MLADESERRSTVWMCQYIMKDQGRYHNIHVLGGGEAELNLWGKPTHSL